MLGFRGISNRSFLPGLAALLLCGSASAGTKTAVPNVQVPAVVARSVKTGHTSSSMPIHIAVSLPYGDPQGIQAYVDALANPRSPHYRRFLTPEQVGEWFGLPQARVSEVASYLNSKGFIIRLIGKNRLSILADGTVSQAEAAFGTTINNYRTLNSNEPGSTSFFSFSTPLMMPSSLAPYVLSIDGLENFTRPIHNLLSPSQGQVLYNLAPMFNAGFTGTGRTVGVSNWDGFRLSNLPLFYAHFGLPAPPGGVKSNVAVEKIGVGSGTGPASGEGDLDIEMVLAMAPLCNEIVYDGPPDSDLIDVLTVEANDDTADIITTSYSWGLDAATAIAAHDLHLSMSAEGITYMAASGDRGTNVDLAPYPNFDPEVLLVGGTFPTTDSLGNRLTEAGWGGSTGGWSISTVPFNLRPAYQVGNGVPTNLNFRLGPDIAIAADGVLRGWSYYTSNGLSTGSGTSFSSPVFAGGLADVEQKIISLGGLPPDLAGHSRFGRIQDLIYAQNGRPDVWLDMTVGNNGVLPNGQLSTCTPGWDMVTGWGVINFDAFVSSVMPETVLPGSFHVDFGRFFSGTLPDLFATDANRLIVLDDPTLSRGLPPVRIEFDGVVPAGLVTELDFTLVAQENLVPVSSGTQKVEMFDFATASWVLVDTRPGTATDQTVTIANTTNPSDFIDPATHAVKARVSLLVSFVQPTRGVGERVNQATWLVKH